MQFNLKNTILNPTIVMIICLLSTACNYAQSIAYTQKYVDTFAIRPLNKENLQNFKAILEGNDKLYGWSKYHANHGYYHYLKAQKDSAAFHAKKAINFYQDAIAKHANEENAIVWAYFVMGNLSRQESRYQESNNYLLKGLDISRKYGVPLKSYIIGSIASNHLSMGNNQLALGYYHEIIKDTMYTKSAQAEISTLTRIGVLYSKTYLQKVDSSYIYFHKALKRSLLSDYKNNLPFIYGNIADYFRDTDQDSALFYYKQSKKAFEDFFEEPNFTLNNTDYYQLINNSYVDIHDHKVDRAIQNLSQIIDSLKPNVVGKNDRDMLSVAYENLVLAFENKNNHRKANAVLREQLRFERTFAEKLQLQELEKLQIAHETRKKEERIIILEEEAKASNTILKQQKTIAFSTLGIGVLVLTLGGLFYRQRILNEKYKQVSLEQRLLRSQLNPHFLFNALSAAAVLVDHKTGQAKIYLQKLAKLLRLTLENSRADFVPLEKELAALENYLQLQSNFSFDFDYEIEIDGAINPEFTQIPPMLIQPFIENAIVHGITPSEDRGKIKLELAMISASVLVCTVLDNGVGHNTAKTNVRPEHASLSLSIVQERLAIYQKKYKENFLFKIGPAQFSNCQSRGTQVVFSFPFYSL